MRLPLWLALMSSILAIAAGIKCKDEWGFDLDWYVVYKAPRQVDPDGTAHFFIRSKSNYYDQREAPEKFFVSNYDINDPMSMISRTLQPLWEPTQRQLFMPLMYDDEVQNNSEDDECGHGKGLVIFSNTADNSSGIWIVHSIPNLNLTRNYQLPDSERKYGHIVLCVSVPDEQKNIVDSALEELNVHQLEVPESQIYRSSALVDDKPDKDTDNETSSWLSKNITLENGQTILLFSGTDAGYNFSLYSDWIAPALGTDMYIHSWPVGPEGSSSVCTKEYALMTVEKVELPNEESFSSRLDHSEWAVSTDSDRPWVCIGGTSRKYMTDKKSGGAFCFQDESAWTAFDSLVNEFETCTPAGVGPISLWFPLMIIGVLILYIV